jgi:hypothetical protein
MSVCDVMCDVVLADLHVYGSMHVHKLYETTLH